MARSRATSKPLSSNALSSLGCRARQGFLGLAIASIVPLGSPIAWLSFGFIPLNPPEPMMIGADYYFDICSAILVLIFLMYLWSVARSVDRHARSIRLRTWIIVSLVFAAARLSKEGVELHAELDNLGRNVLFATSNLSETFGFPLEVIIWVSALAAILLASWNLPRVRELNQSFLERRLASLALLTSAVLVLIRFVFDVWVEIDAISLFDVIALVSIAVFTEVLFWLYLIALVSACGFLLVLAFRAPRWLMSLDPGKCPSCNYDVSNLSVATCPECGSPLSRQ